MSVDISSSDLMEDERLKGSITVRGFSGSLPVGEGGMLVSSMTEEVDAIAGSVSFCSECKANGQCVLGGG